MLHVEKNFPFYKRKKKEKNIFVLELFYKECRLCYKLQIDCWIATHNVL